MMPGYPGAPQGGGSQDYDFATLYGMADHSAGHLYPEAWYDAVVESAEYGRTKDGSKGQWTVKFRTTTGENPGRSPITTTISISPIKQDGQPNPMGLGILFRHLAALGVPVPDPSDMTKTVNGQAPFWVMRWTYEQVAQAMVGRPAYVKLVQDEYDGITRNKVRDIRPARPGAPVTWPQQQMPQAQQAPAGFAPPQYGQPPAGYGQPPAPPQPSYGQQPDYGAQPQWQQPPAPPAQVPGFAPPPWQQQPQAPQAPPQQPQWQQPPQQPQGPPPPAQVPGAPPWAQPGQPGQGGYGEFTQQGQSQQPGMAPQQPGQQPGMPPVPQLPWTQQPPGQPGYPPNGGQPQQAAPQGQQGPQDGPPAQMPWMQ